MDFQFSGNFLNFCEGFEEGPNFYEGDVERAIVMNNYILDNREEVVKESIIRKITTINDD
jgi:hypothetical protein